MAEGRVAEVVRQRDGFHQVFVQAQRPRDRTRQLRHFDRVREPRAEQVALVVQEHLGLVDQAAEGRGVHDAVAVALEVGARRRGRLGMAAPAAARGIAGIGGGSCASAVQSASTWRTIASGAPRTPARPGRLDHDEADLAAFGLLVHAHQLQVAVGAQRGADRRQARARDQRVRRCDEGFVDQPEPLRQLQPPSPCRSPPPRRAATRRSRGPIRWRGRRCGRN
jgi:hypothetical protein